MKSDSQGLDVHCFGTIKTIKDVLGILELLKYIVLWRPAVLDDKGQAWQLLYTCSQLSLK